MASEPAPSAAGKMAAASGLGPGDMVAGRFCIGRFLGRGRFAEVFKADDTRLHRYVALKVPLSRIGPGAELWRLAREVKTAQQVAHPNVVRAWELGLFKDDAGGQRAYIASQLIEGDTLASVLERSVGGLSREEKLSIAHDLCAAVEAIHRQRVLHRDLKPGNVMLTVDGRAVVTDFGLATLVGGATDPRSGTPGYRAPELEQGAAPTVRSDLYALGVMLYELFTGRLPLPPVRDAEDGHDDEPAFPADEHVAGVVEGVRRCLDREPEKRPSSAAELAASLPPRPSPEDDRSWTVPVETLLIDPAPRFSPAMCWRWLASAVTALLLVLALGGVYRPLHQVTAGEPPVVLEYRARDLLAAAGLGAAAGSGGPRWQRGDRTTGYSLDVGGGGHGPPRAAFWMRWSPSPLVVGRSGTAFLDAGDPAFGATAGEVKVQLDPAGRLLSLDAVPMPGAAAGNGPVVEWRQLLRAAGLEAARLRGVPPSAAPLPFADSRWAWQVEDPRPGGPARVEAAAFGGTPVYFRTLTAGDGEQQSTGGGEPERASAPLVLAWLWTGLALAGGLFLCHRHLRRRVADLRGATRLATFMLAGRFLVWVLGGHHTSSPGELEVLEAQLERGLHDGLRAWILYVALEPFARRRWAKQVASWVRLLHGRWRDPLLGRDLLVGCTTGLALALGAQLYAIVPGWLDVAPSRPDSLASLAGLFDDHALDRQLQAVLGLRESLSMSLFAVLQALMLAFLATVGVVFLRVVLRRAVWSRPLAILLMSVMLYPGGGHPLADALVVVAISSLWITVLIRFGFLAGVTAVVVAWLLNSHPLSLDLEAWHVTGAMVPLVLVTALVLWGLRAALGKRRLVTLPP